MEEAVGSALILGSWVLFFAGLGLCTVIGAILSYHWIRYSMNPVMPTFAFVAYVGGCALLLSIMFAALIAA